MCEFTCIYVVLLLQGLFRKVMNAEIKPHDLVRLSSEQLASKELAMWREQETKHVCYQHDYSTSVEKCKNSILRNLCSRIKGFSLCLTLAVMTVAFRHRNTVQELMTYVSTCSIIFLSHLSTVVFKVNILQHIVYEQPSRMNCSIWLDASQRWCLSVQVCRGSQV